MVLASVDLDVFPPLNASLNAFAGVLTVVGYVAIRRDERQLHARFMVAAAAVSAVFLVCYLYYHANAELVTRFTETGVVRGVYYTILVSHIVLAATVPVPGAAHAVSGVAAAVRRPPPDRPLDVSDLGVRVGDGRTGLPDALPVVPRRGLSRRARSADPPGRGVSASGEVAPAVAGPGHRRIGCGLGVLERPAVAPHARLVAEAVTVRALVMAAGAVPFGLTQVLEEGGHPDPSASLPRV